MKCMQEVTQYIHTQSKTIQETQQTNKQTKQKNKSRTWQLVHAVRPASSAYVPGEHKVHDNDPEDDVKVPALHWEQAVDAESAVEIDPAGQRVHDVYGVVKPL